MSAETKSLDLEGNESVPEKSRSSKPKLYEGKIPLHDLSFVELLRLLKPRISFHCRKSTKDTEYIPGFAFDDLFQELSILTFQILEAGKLDDHEFFDYRLLRYMDTVYRNKINMMWRRNISRRRGEVFFRDALNSALTQIDDFDKLFDPNSE